MTRPKTSLFDSVEWYRTRILDAEDTVGEKEEELREARETLSGARLDLEDFEGGHTPREGAAAPDHVVPGFDFDSAKARAAMETDQEDAE